MQMKKTTKSDSKPTSQSKISVKVATAKAAKTKAAQEIPIDAIAKMKKWNEAHPDQKFSWVVVSVELPATQRVCKTCKKEFKDGRVTRVDAHGAYCGPRCQLKSSK